ncbi:MAG TPA: 4-(cytidine 5'-diphospho)-2-C-methyl-D-erythritol kinase [Candidatus Sabulitectum sp.]|nr:4-(cytidine 5'-diphospho)-2-C-methyl-D-erythritol kinase [Candidatus Sabulitectum sp.]HPF31610.1 4-(cytidine 5'-diphospho)-2-C-methyl-D-erythritol kinase [Candidatus Sabulitectum sp.]HPJ28667.1 4-(cytidine 5'-diphospho)-2-C-methyl-D-erythritol kinase [Candidatus Sabulitectum sp.]HPR22215.1 4-(cytidine 5'-diphospho)-2-C-methyl-D-erythritol kinase [Candidatus Sabulitectum sp.]
MSSLVVRAHAKLNLGLRITGLRPDGFHSIESVFSQVSLYDELTVELTGEPGSIVLKCTGIPSPRNEENIVWRAVELFRKATGNNSGVALSLHKNIPSPGGLGGGSSDGAAVLSAMGELTRSSAVLGEAGAALGSDVPFFMAGHPSALVTGRGELVTPFTVPGYHAVLVNCMEEIPTPVAYRLWDEHYGHLTGAGPVNHYTALNFGVWHEGKPFPVELGNHFLPVLSRRYRGVAETAADLAEFSDNWGLSGSGPVFYALFAHEEEAMEAEDHLRGKYPWVFRCRSRQIGASSNG